MTNLHLIPYKKRWEISFGDRPLVYILRENVRYNVTKCVELLMSVPQLIDSLDQLLNCGLKSLPVLEFTTKDAAIDFINQIAGYFIYEIRHRKKPRLLGL